VSWLSSTPCPQPLIKASNATTVTRAETNLGYVTILFIAVLGWQEVKSGFITAKIQVFSLIINYQQRQISLLRPKTLEIKYDQFS
jgi:hypothetical protein